MLGVSLKTCIKPFYHRYIVVRASAIVYAVSSFAVLGGLFLIALYFFDLLPGDSTKGVVFFLRMGASLMVAIPVMITQLLVNTPRPQRGKLAEKIGLIVVLGIGLILSVLLLPQMYVGTTWSP